jgi:hypothetical protein
MRIWMIATAASLLMATSARADVMIFTMGIGRDSCAKFVASTEGSPLGKHRSKDVDGVTVDERKAEYMEFANGFITGVNVVRQAAKKKQLESDSTEVELWLKKRML